MLIKIDVSVVTHIGSQRERLQASDSVIVALNNLATAYREGDHVLIGSLDTFEFLKDYDLLDASARRIYHQLYSRFAFMGAYESIFEEYILVMPPDSPSRNIVSGSKCVFARPITFYVKANRTHKTSLVCEDISDYDFFVKLAQKFIEENQAEYNVRLSFTPVNGGGNNTYKMYERHISFDEMVLAVADSDKELPTSQVGQTLQNLRQVYIKYKESKVTALVELEVREKENMISPSLYLLGANSSLKHQLNNLCKLEGDPKHQTKLLYMDLKDGVRVGKLRSDEKLFEFYKELSIDAQDLFACSLEDIDSLDEEHKVVNGLGSNLIKDFLRNILDDGLDKMLLYKRKCGVEESVLMDIEDCIKKKNNLFSLVPDYLKSPIESLCKKIITWGCSHDRLAI